MEINERGRKIIDILISSHFASIADLASAIYTSEATVRREISKLETLGAVKTVYGGVVIAEYEKAPVPISLRDKENSAEKEMLAERAAKLVRDNSTVILDSSSTVRRMCKHLSEKRGLTVITNNLRVIEALRGSAVRIILTGGTFVPERDCFVGHLAESFIGCLKADAVFLSSQGVSENGDITDSSEEEISMRKVMMSVSREKIFLADGSKIGREYPLVLANISEMNECIIGK